MKKLCLLIIYVMTFTTILHAYNSPATIHSVIEKCNHSQIQYVQCFFTDLQGIFREIILPAYKLPDALYNGLKFDGSSIPGYSNISTSDMHLALDASTYHEHENLGFIFCTVYQDEHTPYEADPRWLLEQAISKAQTHHYIFNVGAEIEFFLLDAASNPCDQEGYVQATNNAKLLELEIALLNALTKFGIITEKIHHEVAPGQYEIVLQYADALTIADRIMLTRYIITRTAQEYGLVANFLPKPFLEQNGSGMHIHFSLYNSLHKENVFADPFFEQPLSMLAQEFIAGILNNIAQYTIVTNPTINSYLRIRPGFEAPTNICWSPTNRSALIRIPQINATQSNAARAEFRCPDSSTNPYLLFAFMLNAGLQGIEEKAHPWPLVTENIFSLSAQQKEDAHINNLPGSFEEALYNFKFVKNHLFPQRFHTVFTKLQEQQLHPVKSH